MSFRSFVRTRRLLVYAAVAITSLAVAIPGLGADSFDDVPADHTFADDITWLADEGITRGCNPPSNTRFCPDDHVTRGQMAAFLVRALDLPAAGDQGFTDSAGTFEANIDALAAAGITRGCNPPDNDRFCPEGLVTRGQMAAFLHRALTMEPPVSATAVDVSVGQHHACAVTVDGRVLCWGANNNGQLGVASPASSNVPVAVPGLANMANISAGGNHTCAATTSGEAYCWGLGANGRLGTGDDASTSTPTPVVGLTGVETVESGENFSCALKDDGTVWCWGFGPGGHLGDGAAASSDVPVQVSGISDAVNLSVGYSHSCVTTSSYEAWCWGETGRPGDGTAGGGGVGEELVPVRANLSNVARVTAGQRSTCAFTLAGAMYCWGYNGEGQLGLGNKVTQDSPTAVPGMSQVLSIEAGHFTTCAIDTESDTYCWGKNSNGTAAIGSTGDDILSPQKALLERAMMVDHAYNNACAVSVEGEVSCWGDNTLGQLGIGSSGGVQATPRTVILPG